MKNKVFYMSMLLMCIMTSCGDDNAPPTPDPTLSIAPATALHFTASATESNEINVKTNQDSWTAISNQNWCKVTQDKNKLIVKADPNTTETSPAPATITISAGSAKSIMLAVTQDAATNEPDATYPATEADLIKAVAKTWTFPETSDYISLELNEEKHYSLLTKTKIATRSEEANGIYIIEGTYTISDDLRILSLTDFGKIEIKDIKQTESEITITPTGKDPFTVTTTEQKIETPPTRTGKRLKTYIPDFGDEGVMNYTFTYDDKNRLVKLSVDIDGKTQELSIKYENQKISFDLPGEELEATGNIACTYTLNTAGLATDLQVKIGKAIITQRYTYNNARQLISVRRYEGGEMTAYCNAVWENGNVTSTISGSKHICTDESYQDNEGNTVYVHDHNQDNKFDDNDKALAPGAYDTHSSAYTYTAEKNKGGFLIPTYSPDIFDMFDFGDWLAAMTGILGKLPENQNKDNSNGFFTFAYTFEGDYPKTLQVNAKEHGEEFKATITFE